MGIVKKLPVAKVGEIGEGKAKHFRFGPRNGIAYNDKGEIRAFVNACTHMGGRTDLQSDGRLHCHMHQAMFDPKTGARLEGQAPEGSRLTPIELVTEGEDILAVWEINDEFSF